MTIVNHTSATHSGLLVTGTGDHLEIDLEVVGGRTLRMSAAGDELGAWPIDECLIENDPAKSGSFRLVVDGEDAEFTPSDPVGFQSLIDQVMGGSATDDDLTPDRQNEDPEPETGSAVEDPVAFLFGSTPPPTPVATELGDFDLPDAGHELSYDPPEARTPDAEVEEVETITAGAAWESPVDIAPPSQSAEARADEAAPVDLDTDADDGFDVDDGPVPAPLVEDSPPDWIDDDEELDLEDAAEEQDERIGDRSALGRISAVIGSLRSSGEEHEGEDDDGVYHVGPNTVATDVLETQRNLREHQLKEMAKTKWLKWGGMAVATTAVIALFAFLTPRAIDFLQSYESDIAPPPEVETTAPPTAPSVAGADTAPDDTGVTTPEALPIGAEADTIFDRSSPEFITSWDAAGGAIDAVLMFDGFPQLGAFEEQFTPYLRMNGIVQPDGTLDQFTLVIDPTGPAEYDRIGIQALGVAIATVDPERSPEGRASLLGELGLNVRQPLLEGVDGAAESAGIAYTLFYDAAANLLTLTVSPAG